MELKEPLRYVFHVIVRPFDGFWDLKHEKRGSLAAAAVILAIVMFTVVLRYPLSGFAVMIVNWEYFNIFRVLLNSLIPFMLWCASNWCLTTLMDGKGSFKDIFIASSYALAPYALINIPLIAVSNVITGNEYVFYAFFYYLAEIWCVGLMLAAMMMTHEYSFGKAIFSSLLTLVGIGIMVFLFMIFFSLISDSAAYFIALYKEISFRFY